MTKGLFFGMVKATTQDFEFKSRYLKESLIGKNLEIDKWMNMYYYFNVIRNH